MAERVSFVTLRWRADDDEHIAAAIRALPQISARVSTSRKFANDLVRVPERLQFRGLCPGLRGHPGNSIAAEAIAQFVVRDPCRPPAPPPPPPRRPRPRPAPPLPLHRPPVHFG